MAVACTRLQCCVLVPMCRCANPLILLSFTVYEHLLMQVLATVGHVTQLAPNGSGVVPDQDFTLNWMLTPRAGPRLAELAAAVRGAGRVLLATDPDREGEAISWHVLEQLKVRASSQPLETTHTRHAR